MENQAGKLFSSFPFTEVRDSQKYIMKELEKVWDNPKIKYIIVEAPTGVGKSPLVIAAALASDKAYIGTVNKLLQDQYNRDFGHLLHDLKGRATYACTIDSSFNAKNAICADSKEPLPCKKRCEYFLKRSAAQRGPMTIMNFNALVMQLNTDFEARETVIIDEAHNLTDVITDIGSFKVDIDKLRELGIFVTLPSEANDTIEAYVLIAKSVRRQIEDVIKLNAEKGLPEKIMKDFKELDFSSYVFLSEYIDVESINYDEGIVEEKLDEKSDKQEEKEATANKKAKKPKYFKINPSSLLETEQTIKLERPINHTISRGETEFKTPIVSLQPITIRGLINKYLLRFAEKRTIFLSATILDFNTYMDINGLDPALTHIIKVESDFPIENRPIFYKYNVGRLDKDNIKEMMPAIKDRIDLIAGHYATKKGIIHTHTYDIAKFIYENSKLKKRFLFPKSAKDQKEMLEKHFESKLPTILLSPSMTEGVDLKGSSSEFQIFCKVPFPYFGDPLTRARAQRYPNYTDMLTAINLAQSYGRSIRSKTDVAYSFMLDGIFDFWIRKNRTIVQDSYYNAIIWQ